MTLDTTVQIFTPVESLTSRNLRDVAFLSYQKLYHDLHFVRCSKECPSEV